MGRTVLFSSAVLIVAGLTGCGTTARTVARHGDTGVVAIPENTNTWPYYHREKAEELIRQTVGSNYEIIDEHEVVTGATTLNNQQVKREQLTPGAPFLPPVERDTIQNSTTTQNLREYQITYRRKGGGGPLPSAVAPAGGVQRPVGAGAGQPVATGVQPAGGIIPSVMPADSGPPPTTGLAPQGRRLQ